MVWAALLAGNLSVLLQALAGLDHGPSQLPKIVGVATMARTQVATVGPVGLDTAKLLCVPARVIRDAADSACGCHPADSACGIDGDTGEMFRARLVPQPEGIRGWLTELPGPVTVAYEAGPTGFGLARFLTGHGDEHAR